WCGRYGEVTNCQVGVYLAYASAEEQALVDVRLYLPKAWARSKSARRRCGVPAEVKFQTRQELALSMLDEHGPVLPHRWVAGDEDPGNNAESRAQLHARRERYLLTVATNTVIRDLQAKRPPQHPGRGAPTKAPWIRADRWRAELPETAWMNVEVAGGE